MGSNIPAEDNRTEKKELTELEKEYDIIAAVEDKLRGELLGTSFLVWGLIVVFGYFAGNENFYFGLIITGLIAWMAGFHLIGLSVAWGGMHAKKIELAKKGGEPELTESGTEETK